MRDFWDPPSADLVNVALVDTIMELLGNEALCPDDILALVRSRIPGISLDRVLITLYENSALFHRGVAAGTWWASRLTSAMCRTRSPVFRRDHNSVLPRLQPPMPDDRLGDRPSGGARRRLVGTTLRRRGQLRGRDLLGWRMLPGLRAMPDLPTVVTTPDRRTP